MTKKKSYDEDFKKMIVELYENKKPVVEIKREYGIAEATGSMSSFWTLFLRIFLFS